MNNFIIGIIMEEAKNLESTSDQLNAYRSSIFMLVLNLKTAHWFVKGPMFFQLHEAFSLYEELSDYEDSLVELMLAGGWIVPASLKEFLEYSVVGELGEIGTTLGSYGMSLSESVAEDLKVIAELSETLHGALELESGGLDLQINIEKFLEIIQPLRYKLNQFIV